MSTRKKVIIVGTSSSSDTTTMARRLVQLQQINKAEDELLKSLNKLKASKSANLD